MLNHGKKTRVPTSNFRIQAQVVKLPSSNILWLSTYFPTDPQMQNYDDSELQDVLAELKMLIQMTEYDEIPRVDYGIFTLICFY